MLPLYAGGTRIVRRLFLSHSPTTFPSNSPTDHYDWRLIAARGSAVDGWSDLNGKGRFLISPPQAQYGPSFGSGIEMQGPRFSCSPQGVMDNWYPFVVSWALSR